MMFLSNKAFRFPRTPCIAN